MSTTFYKFKGAWKKDVIRIQSLVEYDTLSLISQDSPLVQNSKFKIKQGSKLYDIIHFNDSQNFAISQKVKDILETNEFIGWDCFPILIEDINEKYFAFQNISEAGPILNLDAINRLETDRREFDIKSWNGADIFHLQDTLVNVCTGKVKEILVRENISNLDISPL